MTFREFVDVVDTPGGHIIVAIGIGFIGVVVAVLAALSGKDKLAEIATLLTGFFQVAAYAMRGQGKANEQPISTIVQTETVTTSPKKE